MRHLKIAILAAGFAAGSAGIAAAQIDQCSGNGFAGTAIGAVVGGTTGGLIANNVGSSRGRSFRGGGFGRAGFGTGFNRFGGRSGFGVRGRRGNGAIGAVIGAVVGGVAGSQIAAARQRNCINNLRRSQQSAHSSHGYSSGQNGVPIDHNARRLGDPYSGRAIAPSQPTGYSQPAPQPTHSYQSSAPHQTSIVTQPVVSGSEYCTRTDPHSLSVPTLHTTQAGGSFPITTQHAPIAAQPGPIYSEPTPVFSEPAPIVTRSQTLAGGPQAPCRVLDRRTTLPDGTIVSEPIEYCQYSPGGDWVPS